METLTAILVFLLACLIVYMIYVLYFKKGSSNEISGEVNLAQQPPTLSTVIKPGSTNFTYSFWMYVNTWNPDAKIIFTSTDTSASGFYHQLTMDATKPSLIFSVQNDGTTAKKEDIVITESLPLQKWLYVVIRVNGLVLDFYINGKMVKSVQSKTTPTLNITTIKLGGAAKPFDCYVRQFKRIVELISDEQINADYVSGNGMMGLSSAASLEGRVEILKDSQVQTSVKLF